MFVIDIYFTVETFSESLQVPNQLL